MVKSKFLRCAAEGQTERSLLVQDAGGFELRPLVLRRLIFRAGVGRPGPVGILEKKCYRLIGFGFNPAPQHISARLGLFNPLFDGAIGRDEEALPPFMRLLVRDADSAGLLPLAPPVWRRALLLRSFLETRIIEQIVLGARRLGGPCAQPAGSRRPGLVSLLSFAASSSIGPRWRLDSTNHPVHTIALPLIGIRAGSLPLPQSQKCGRRWSARKAPLPSPARNW